MTIHGRTRGRNGMSIKHVFDKEDSASKRKEADELFRNKYQKNMLAKSFASAVRTPAIDNLASPFFNTRPQ